MLQAGREIAMRETTREPEKREAQPPMPRSALETIRRALYSQASTIQHVSVDHRRLKTAVAKQLLYRSDIRTAFEQMRRERVSERRTCRTLRYIASTHSLGHRALNGGFVDVMTPAFAGFALHVNPFRRKDVLPAPVPIGILQLASEGFGQRRSHNAGTQIPLKLFPHTLHLHPQRG